MNLVGLTRVSFPIVIVLFLSVPLGCSKPATEPLQTPGLTQADNPMQSVSTVLKNHSADLLNIPGIEGVAEGTCDEQLACIRIFVSVPAPSISEKVEQLIGDTPHVFEETDGFNAIAIE